MLELKDLLRRYGDTVAVEGLTLEVPAGEVVGFVGPNGAGKTTAMRIAMGVLEADAGQVLWHGEPATRELRRTFGYMPEERGLYPKMRVDRELRYAPTAAAPPAPAPPRPAPTTPTATPAGSRPGSSAAADRGVAARAAIVTRSRLK